LEEPGLKTNFFSIEYLLTFIVLPLFNNVELFMNRRSVFYGLFFFLTGALFFACNNNSSTSPGPKPGIKNNDMANKIEIGSKAPDFSLPDQAGKRVNLSDYIGKSNLVVYFYPKDESYGCTKEACSFRDNYEVFREAGAEVIGISSDDVASHQAFAANHKLPFILLSDKDKTVAGRYGVGKSLGVLPGRVTFVIDKQGIIRLMFSSQLNFEKHITEAIETLKKLP
jgi:thioredoxin-dependent peroxiredoxin